MSTYSVAHEKADSFYDRFFRKSDGQHQTHYCPGCGHGVAHKLIAKVVDEMSLKDRMIFVSPVGCSVFAYYYFDFGNVQAAHGRAAAVAVAVKRARPDSIVVSYQGDGDLAAIGTAEIIHAANRGDNISVFFINNAVYGMTGGQLAPTTLIGQKTQTTPYGRSVENEGYPLRVCELLASLEAPVYLERVSLGETKDIMKAAKAVRRAIENQVEGLGFSLVEILSPCPTIWKMTPTDAKGWVRDEMVKHFPLGIVKDRTKEARERARPARRPAPPLEEIPRIIEVDGAPSGGGPAAARSEKTIDLHVRVAGFGGQGVLLLGQVLAEAGLDAGLEVSWLPSYGPEMRSGTSNCHVRLSTSPIDSPLVSRPDVLLALNEPSLRKFLSAVVPGGLVFYNAGALPDDCRKEGVQIVVRPFAEIADRLGEPRAANIVMLGSMLGVTKFVTPECVLGAIGRLVSSERWLAIDRRALEAGLEAVRGGPPDAA